MLCIRISYLKDLLQEGNAHLILQAIVCNIKCVINSRNSNMNEDNKLCLVKTKNKLFVLFLLSFNPPKFRFISYYYYRIHFGEGRVIEFIGSVELKMIFLFNKVILERLKLLIYN